MPHAQLLSTTDGIVTLRPPGVGDEEVLIAGRDAEFHRWLGEGSRHPQPANCIVVGGAVAGWVDFDACRQWLEPGEVNLGYSLFADRRGRGYGTRALQLLMHQLAVQSDVKTATLLIDPDNRASLALAARARFVSSGQINGQAYFKRAVPPLTYSDGVVTIRRHQPDDLEMHLAAVDDEQIDWLWDPGERELWEAQTAAEKVNHMAGYLLSVHESFGRGPKWTFAVDLGGTSYIAYVDCDLANAGTGPGEANISYAAHPAFRRKGYVSRAVRLLARFLSDHTATRVAIIAVDPGNIASIRVAEAVGAVERDRVVTPHGRRVRFEIIL
ncbi:MAG TPA: GNAT family N-acetyltransferase [Acidimicrobiales bacterium]|jgi:RimJ/RimL family protein N-acetyltransferase|nr:GNAT family N-acetyltransferase [Acidimicrobiales bacterium]